MADKRGTKGRQGTGHGKERAAEARAMEARASSPLPLAGPVTTRRVSAEEAHHWRPAAKPLTLTEITGQNARGGVLPE